MRHPILAMAVQTQVEMTSLIGCMIPGRQGFAGPQNRRLVDCILYHGVSPILLQSLGEKHTVEPHVVLA